MDYLLTLTDSEDFLEPRYSDDKDSQASRYHQINLGEMH